MPGQYDDQPSKYSIVAIALCPLLVIEERTGGSGTLPITFEDLPSQLLFLQIDRMLSTSLTDWPLAPVQLHCKLLTPHLTSGRK